MPSITILGGAGCIGQNCILYTEKNYSVVVDCGIKPRKMEGAKVGCFGEPPTRLDILDEVLNRGSNVIGIITHAHLDHIGAVAELGKRGIPIYLSHKSKAIMEKKYDDNLKIPVGSELIEFYGISTLRYGDFQIVLVPLPHSIPGAYAVLMRVGGKNILHLSDFKFNGVTNTVEETRQALRDIRDISGRIDCLILDVLNSELPGFTPPEQQVFDSMKKILERENGRVVATFFSSNLDRMNGILDVARALGRRVCLGGQGMIDSYALLQRRGDFLVSTNWDLLLTSGSQGEATSGLVRMARGEHRFVQLRDGDTVAFATRAIPGNEEEIRNELVGLHNRGVKIILHHGEAKKLGLDFAVEEMFLHSSGHEQLGGLLEPVGILEPEVIIPIHAPWDRVELFEQAVGGERVRRIEVGETLEV